MNIIDYLSNLNADLNIEMQNKKKKETEPKDYHFDDKKYRVGGIKIEVKEMKAFRKELKMPIISLKRRHCLKCFNVFSSAGAGHRICDECKE